MKEKINIAEILKDKPQKTKFKDWDFITIKLPRERSLIGVFKAENDKKYYLHASLDSRGIITICEGGYCKKSTCIARLSTEEEKMHFFDALAKKGKAWDSVKKAIVDLKPKCEFKPMDLCLMKYIGQYNNRGWELCQYAYTEHRVSSSGEHRDFYHSVGGEIYAECIPYNEDTKHLLGTKTEWKGGEQ